jgi:hypothetical protein
MHINKVYKLSAALTLAAALTACNQASFGQKSQSSTNKQTQANGENYDGKDYDHSEPANPCADSSPVRSVICSTLKGYGLVKRNCAALAPALTLANNEVQVDPGYPALLTYKGQKYILDVSTFASRAADLNCTKRNAGPLDSLKVYATTIGSGSTLVGVLHMDGKTSTVAFDKPVLDTSATGKLSGVDQEGTVVVGLSGFDSKAELPDNTNAAFSSGDGPLGAQGFLYCVRPSGSL